MTTDESYGLSVGTGKLILGLPAALADQNKKTGQDVPPIHMLSISGRSEAKSVVEELAKGHGYDLLVQGCKEDGTDVKETQHIDIVKGATAIDPKTGTVAEQLKDTLEDVRNGKVKYITSNTFGAFETNYPRYLAELLKAGYDAGTDKVADPIPVFPLELVRADRKNGEILKKNVLAVIDSDPAYKDYKLEGRESLKDWVERTYFANTLVDRIVTGKDGSPTAEPFAYIAIEKPKGNVAVPKTEPFGHSDDIKLVDDIIPVQMRKTATLNAMHTSMVQKWILDGREPPKMTVLEFINNNPEWVENLRKDLIAVANVVAPNCTDCNAQTFSDKVMKRFANKDLNHRLNEIAVGHSKKIDDRINFVLDYGKEKFADDMAQLKTPTLDALMKETISDRQIAEAKKAALASFDGVDVTNLDLNGVLTGAMQIKNPQPHKGDDKFTLETPTTPSTFKTSLIKLKKDLGSVLRAQPDKVNEIVDAYRDKAGLAGGLAV